MAAYGIPAISDQFSESGLGGDDGCDRSAIVERFRKLEAAAARAGPNVRSPTTSINTGGGTSSSSSSSSTEPVSDKIGGSLGCGKRHGSVLVAIALDMESRVKRARVGSGSFFDCRICWSVAKDPILTCCGHLFCWGCFYKLPYVMYPTMKCAKECPVCEGEVAESSIVPIYGDADSPSEPKKPGMECGLRDPPRPKARRLERQPPRQMPVTRVTIPVTEALNRIRISVMGQAVVADFGSPGNPPIVLPGDLPLPRSTRFSRGISDEGAFISSALSNAQRLAEDLETYTLLERSVAEFVAHVHNDIVSGNAAPNVMSQQQQGSSGDPSDE